MGWPCMSNMIASKKFIPLLQEISNYLQQLLAALNNEHEALEKNNITSIHNFANEKIILMEHLEDLNKERRVILDDAGLDLTSSGISDFLQNSNSPRSPQMKTLWDDISALSKQCEKQNNINGIVIEANKRRTEEALSILQGKQQNTDLYSNKGKSIKASHHQTLIRA